MEVCVHLKYFTENTDASQFVRVHFKIFLRMVNFAKSKEDDVWYTDALELGTRCYYPNTTIEKCLVFKIQHLILFWRSIFISFVNRFHLYVKKPNRFQKLELYFRAWDHAFPNESCSLNYKCKSINLILSFSTIQCIRETIYNRIKFIREVTFNSESLIRNINP